MRIKELLAENRPRERLEKYGVSVLSDAELLAVILKTGSKEENVVDMSNRLISRYGIIKLNNCSLKDLQDIKGIGKVKASQILALFEFNKRHSLAKARKKQIKSAKDVFDYISSIINKEDKEQFITLHLNTKNFIIKHEIVSVGTLNGTVVHPREIFRSAINENANTIIIAHNHPSGDPHPSKEDIDLTKKIISAGKVVGIDVIDHVIIGKDSYWSYSENQ